jgi:hypothetical protein
VRALELPTDWCIGPVERDDIPRLPCTDITGEVRRQLNAGGSLSDPPQWENGTPMPPDCRREGPETAIRFSVDTDPSMGAKVRDVVSARWRNADHSVRADISASKDAVILWGEAWLGADSSVVVPPGIPIAISQERLEPHSITRELK